MAGVTADKGKWPAGRGRGQPRSGPICYWPLCRRGQQPPKRGPRGPERTGSCQSELFDRDCFHIKHERVVVPLARATTALAKVSQRPAVGNLKRFLLLLGNFCRMRSVAAKGKRPSEHSAAAHLTARSREPLGSLPAVQPNEIMKPCRKNMKRNGRLFGLAARAKNNLSGSFNIGPEICGRERVQARVKSERALVTLAGKPVCARERLHFHASASWDLFSCQALPSVQDRSKCSSPEAQDRVVFLVPFK
ncbi:hypothetical protein VTK26DRAFT_6247 [Humicola hyalothermophila]